MKDLILVRGVVGAGKTTLAKMIAGDHIVAADDYFDLFNLGNFDHRKLKDAHEYCQDIVEIWMNDNAPKIAVHNTFTRKFEMEHYFKLAEEYGYRVHTIVVENRHESESVHQVPPETVAKMKERFEVVL